MKTEAQKRAQRRYAEKLAAAGIKEVRGIMAPAEIHDEIREEARIIIREYERRAAKFSG